METDGVGDFILIIPSLLPPDVVYGKNPVSLGQLHLLTKLKTHTIEKHWVQKHSVFMLSDCGVSGRRVSTFKGSVEKRRTRLFESGL